MPDDEDGLVDELAVSMGTQPRVNVIVTNTTGKPARLTGWIDYNADGVFDDDERAQALVTGATTNVTATLDFPTVTTSLTNGFIGKSYAPFYARFRLSTDAAGEEPTGLATDGEVEDYKVTIGGDFDGNSVLDCDDVDGLVEESVTGTNDSAFDITDDELVNREDLMRWIDDVFGTLHGDANLEGNVNSLDLGIWRERKFTNNNSWCGGDFNASVSSFKRSRNHFLLKTPLRPHVPLA